MRVWPYTTQHWRRLRLAKLAQDPVCEYCDREPATQVDHRVAINHGGDPWAWSNLASTCASCHARKTNFIDRQGKASVPNRGCDVDGKPLDGGHWWR